MPTEHPGRRATALTSVECSGPLLEVPVQSRDREHTPAPKPKPSWRVLLVETCAKKDRGEEPTSRGGTGKWCQVPRAVFGPWLSALTLTAPFSLRLDLDYLKVSAFVIATSQ